MLITMKKTDISILKRKLLGIFGWIQVKKELMGPG